MGLRSKGVIGLSPSYLVFSKLMGMMALLRNSDFSQRLGRRKRL